MWPEQWKHISQRLTLSFTFKSDNYRFFVRLNIHTYRIYVCCWSLPFQTTSMFRTMFTGILLLQTTHFLSIYKFTWQFQLVQMKYFEYLISIEFDHWLNIHKNTHLFSGGFVGIFDRNLSNLTIFVFLRHFSGICEMLSRCAY